MRLEQMRLSPLMCEDRKHRQQREMPQSRRFEGRWIMKRVRKLACGIDHSKVKTCDRMQNSPLSQRVRVGWRITAGAPRPGSTPSRMAKWRRGAIVLKAVMPRRADHINGK
jgi:hypothetical protein